MEGALVDGVPRDVPVVTIDGVCAEKRLAEPYLIKVDMQAHKLQVLAGGERTLRETEAVILEVTLFMAMIEGPQLYDVLSRMKDWRFVTYDLFGLHYRHNALSQVDMVFVQERGRFRQTHAYATPEQRRERFSSAAQSELQAGSEGVVTWLGHVSLNTTNVYAEVDLEMKAKALATCEVRGAVPQKHWKKDVALMHFLRSL